MEDPKLELPEGIEKWQSDIFELARQMAVNIAKEFDTKFKICEELIPKLTTATHDPAAVRMKMMNVLIDMLMGCTVATLGNYMDLNSTTEDRIILGMRKKFMLHHDLNKIKILTLGKQN